MKAKLHCKIWSFCSLDLFCYRRKAERHSCPAYTGDVREMGEQDLRSLLMQYQVTDLIILVLLGTGREVLLGAFIHPTTELGETLAHNSHPPKPVMPITAMFVW